MTGETITLEHAYKALESLFVASNIKSMVIFWHEFHQGRDEYCLPGSLALLL